MSEEGKLIEFKKRFEDRFEPPKVIPKWLITYALTKDNNISEIAEGYLASVMPTLTVMLEEDSKTLNEIVFSLPYDRIVNIKRYVESA